MNRKLVTTAVGASLSMSLIFPMRAVAHNAGHVTLPSGECVNVGGENTVHLPDSAQAYTNAAGELDLIPTTAGDEFGARFAAEQGRSRVLPRSCP